MDERVGNSPILSPYHRFTRDEWATLRAGTPLTLSMEDLTRLRSLNDPISLEEVVAIYLPLSRLLALYVAATQGLYKATQRFLGAEGGKVPYIIGVAGSVAAGKSTLSRVMQALLSRWPNTPKVELVTTDGFLYPNVHLEGEGLLEKKGFPESYDGARLLCFLSDVKAGKRNVQAPVYSHVTYDVISGESIIVDRPDILIVEGLNVLLPNRPARDGRAIPFVSDFFDFSIYLHAAEKISKSGLSPASCACATPVSAILNLISRNTPPSTIPRRKRPRAPFGQESIFAICAKASFPRCPARASC